MGSGYEKARSQCQRRTQDRKMAAKEVVSHLKQTAIGEIKRLSDELLKLNQNIWNNPELAYQEKYAHDFLSNFLEEKGFRVTRHHTLETAFRAEICSGDTAGLTVGVICEYDALPGIGHACGHNLIAEAGVGAALGKKNSGFIPDNTDK